MARAKKRKERKRAGSQKRIQRQKAGGSFTCIKLPPGVSMFKPEDKRYKLDVINYEVGDNNPNADPGEWYFELTYFAHTGIGPDGKRYVCPAKTAKLPCPICEERARIAADPEGDEQLLKDLNPSQRQLWLFRDKDDGDSGVQLFDHSWWLFGRTFDDLFGDADEDETHITNFDDPTAGSTLIAKFSKTAKYGMEIRSIEFRPRPNGCPDEWLDHGICLDDLLIVPGYEELKKLFLQIEDDEDEDEDEDEPEKKPKPKSKSKPKKEPEPDDDDDDDDEPTTADEKGIKKGLKVTYDDDECEVTKVSKDGTSLTLKDSDEDVIRAVGVDEVELVEEKEEKPKKGKGRKKKEPEPEPDADDDDDDDEWDD